MKILERLMKTNGLRIRVLVPLILALIFLLGSMTLILQQSQQKVLGQVLATRTRETERLFLEYRNEEAKTLNLALSTLSLNKELMAAFKARDRERLLDLTKSYFERLKSRYDVTHLYFTGPDRVNILRVHEPSRYGDRIDRFTTLEAERTGRESLGVELGPLGTFTLRVVTPWCDGESLLGYVELGMETEHIFKELQGILDSSVYVFINKEFLQREGWEAGIRMLGHKEEWGHFPDTVIIGEPLGQVPENVAQVIAGKQTSKTGTPFQMNGRYFRVAYIPVTDAGKREVGHIAILLDTTTRVSAYHRSVLLICIFYVLVGTALIVFFFAFLGQIERKQKRLEESRLEFEKKFRIVFDNANDGIILVDIDTRKFYLGNKMICSMLGYGSEEIKTLGVTDIHPEEDLPRVLDKFERVLRSELSVAENLPVKRKDGTVFYADISASPVTLDGRIYLVGIFRDITERTKTEERIRESETRYRSIFEYADDIIYLLDSDGTIRSLNPAFERITQWPPEEWIGKPFAPIVHPDDLPFANDTFLKTLAGKSSRSFRLRLARKSGEYFDADLCITPLGGDVVTGALGIARDVTERKRAEDEIRRLNEELETRVQERTRQLLDAQQDLIRKEKLSILGQLAGIVGHELRNPLGVMSNAVYFLKTVVPDSDATIREYLDIIKNEIDNSLRIITDLLDFSRTKTPEAKAVAVNELIRRILGRCVVPAGVTVSVDIPETLPQVKTDPFQIGQVLQNLFTNAIQAMPNGGSLRIAARPSPATPSLDKGRPEDAEDRVEISVTDTGAGIAPEDMGKLFQPLYTTKRKGVGLGLTVCKTLTEANGGAIRAESAFGTGTTFSVSLPKAS